MLKRITRPEDAPPWNLFTALAVVIALVLSVIIGSNLANILFGQGAGTLLLGWLIGMGIAIFFVSTRFSRSPQQTAALRMAPSDRARRLPIVFMFGFGMAITIDLIGLAITGNFWPVPELLGFFLVGSDGGLISLNPGLFEWAIALVFLLLMQPIAEEAVFRGTLFPSLRAELGPIAGLVIVSVFHAVFHLVMYAPQGSDFTLLWYALFTPFLDSLVITAVRADTGSTRAAIVAHAAFGLFAVLKALFIVGG